MKATFLGLSLGTLVFACIAMLAPTPNPIVPQLLAVSAILALLAIATPPEGKQ